MTGINVWRIFRELGWSRLEAAEKLGLNEKTIRRWSSSGAPPHGARALKLLRDGKINAEQAKRLLTMDFERRPAA